ncbi:ankyrin repeat-containing domain protein [Zopfochytrium polystomum]|nr:ankyrin repeat-containing domain protein [Zopfochytrium polystomum]
MTLDNKVLEAALLARQRDVADWLMDQGTLLETRAPGILSVLYFAATNGHNDVVEWLLKHGFRDGLLASGARADPNARNSREMTVLGLACNLREAELAKILLQRGADTNLPAVGSTSPILMAALYGDLEILRILHQNGGSIAHSSAMSSPMVAACMTGQAEVIEYLLDHDVDVNGKLEGGMTPIFYAVLLNRLDIAEVLFWNGANLDATTHQDRTLLHLVAEKGNAEAIKWLLQHAAENDARDDMNMTPLHHACNGGHADAARVLLAYGAEVNERDDNDQTPLVHAVWSGHLAAMMVLVEHGVNLTAASDQDKSALSLAAQEGNLGGVRWLSGSPEVAEFLLDNGLVKGNLAYDWLEQAARFGEVEIVEMILSRLPERVFSGEGYPGRDWANVMAIALHAAVQHSHLEVVRVLLDYGVAVDALAVDVLGYRCLWTALHHACQSGNHVMVRALVEAGADVRAVTDPTRAPKDYPYGSETTKIRVFERLGK